MAIATSSANPAVGALVKDWAGPQDARQDALDAPVWLPVGSPVQYYSRSSKDWIPARITGYKKELGFYELDVQPMAAVARVRPLPAGTPVYYYSTSRGTWIPTFISSFDWAKCVYGTDVQPLAKPWMVRERPTEDSSSSSAQAPRVYESGYTGQTGNAYGNDGRAQATVKPRDRSSQDTIFPPTSAAQRHPLGSALLPAPRDAPQRGDPTGGSMELLIARLPRDDEPEAACRRTERRFKCPLCLDEAELEQGVSLDCYHKLCGECFGDYCSSKIAEGRVMENELVCPALNDANKICGRAITVEQVRGNVGAELFDKFCMFRAANWKPHEDDGRLLHCPTPGCAAFMVSPDIDSASCPTCKTDLCTRCGQPLHKGESCEEAARRAKEGASEAERQFEQMLATQGWMRCPSCKCPAEWTRGCFFMQCQSERCRGKTHFCYLCGEMLKGEDHMPGRSLGHFPRGPYNAECVNVSEETYRERLSKQDKVEDEGDMSNAVLDLVEGARRFLEF